MVLMKEKQSRSNLYVLQVDGCYLGHKVDDEVRESLNEVAFFDYRRI